jgi:hypothetical protein
MTVEEWKVELGKFPGRLVAISRSHRPFCFASVDCRVLPRYADNTHTVLPSDHITRNQNPDTRFFAFFFSRSCVVPPTNELPNPWDDAITVGLDGGAKN